MNKTENRRKNVVDSFKFLTTSVAIAHTIYQHNKLVRTELGQKSKEYLKKNKTQENTLTSPAPKL